MTSLATRQRRLSASDDLQRYLSLLAGDEPDGRLLEIRFRLRGGGMGREFIPAQSCARAAGLIIRRLSTVTDVYVGVALRDRRAGGREAVGRCHLLFVEIDEPDAEQRLDGFACPATATISSGGEGRRHSYWLLSSPVGATEVESANRRLVNRLGGDPVAVDAGRMLRPPASWNWKYKPRQPVRLLEFEPTRRYDLSELIHGLPQPSTRPRKARPARARELQNPVDQSLLAIPAGQYVRALTGLEPNRAGKVRCPFHELSVGQAGSEGVSPARSLEDASLSDRGTRQERSESGLSGRTAACPDRLRLVPPPVYFERLTGLRVGRSGKLRCIFHDDQVPSLHVYREPERGWYCFGCRRGGSIYDLAALLSGRSTRGSDFRELRRELESLFL